MAFFKTGTEASMTRLCFFSVSMMLLVWETYAVFARTTVPHIESILIFAGGMLANKQYQERKTNAAVPAIH